MEFSHINTREIHPAYRAVSLSGPARLPYKQALRPEDFTRQGESAATQWVNQTNLPMHPVNLLSGNAPYFVIILLCLWPDNFTHQGESVVTQWVKVV